MAKQQNDQYDLEVSIFGAAQPIQTYFYASGTSEECARQLRQYRDGFMEANSDQDPTGRNEGLRLLNRALHLIPKARHSSQPALSVVNEYTGTAALVSRTAEKGTTQ